VSGAAVLPDSSAGVRLGPTHFNACGSDPPGAGGRVSAMKRVRIPLARAALWLLVGGYAAGVGSGGIAFTLWSQITDMLEAGATLSTLDLSTNAHALRFALMWPVIQGAAAAGLPLDLVFGWTVGGVVLWTAHLVDRTRGLVVTEVRYWYAGRLAAFVVFLGLSLLMNGRLSFAFFGMALLLQTLVLRGLRLTSNLRTFIRFPLVLWLTSVSSGTFAVALGTMLVWSVMMLFARYPSVRLRDAVFLAALALGAVGVFPVLWLYVLKNVNFYGGGLRGFFNMLNHGPGKLIARLGPELVVPLALIGALMAGLVMAFTLTRKPTIAPPSAAVLVALAVGLFGNSTMLMALPGAVILAGALLTPRHVRRTREMA
jgi:hypothetical protein